MEGWGRDQEEAQLQGGSHMGHRVEKVGQEPLPVVLVEADHSFINYISKIKMPSAPENMETSTLVIVLCHFGEHSGKQLFNVY